MSQSKILWAFDPGDTSGYAVYRDGALVKWGSCKGLKDLLRRLGELVSEYGKPYVIVVEDYKIRPNVNHSFSRVNTIQVIGALKAKAIEFDCKYILQDASIKPIGYKWFGMLPPKDHNISHETDAFVHGYYYLVRTNVRKPALIEKAEEEASANQSVSGDS